MADADFNDGKEEGALRTIGEVSKALNIKTHVLRYWEQQFPMLEPLKRSGGRRYYRPEDVALIQRIDELVNQQGYTLKGAKQALKEDPASTGEAEAEQPLEQEGAADVNGAAAEQETAEEQEPEFGTADIIARLKDIRGNLAAALQA